MDEIKSNVKRESRREYPWKARTFHSGTVDGMDCIAFPGISRDGHMELFGEAEEYNRCFIDRKATEHAYRLARQARFEYGETPRIRRKHYA